MSELTGEMREQVKDRLTILMGSTVETDRSHAGAIALLLSNYDERGREIERRERENKAQAIQLNLAEAERDSLRAQLEAAQGQRHLGEKMYRLLKTSTEDEERIHDDTWWDEIDNLVEEGDALYGPSHER
jgi:hypothetical protein